MPLPPAARGLVYIALRSRRAGPRPAAGRPLAAPPAVQTVRGRRLQVPMVPRATSIGGLHWDVPLCQRDAAPGALLAAGSPPVLSLYDGRGLALLHSACTLGFPLQGRRRAGGKPVARFCAGLLRSRTRLVNPKSCGAAAVRFQSAATCIALRPAPGATGWRRAVSPALALAGSRCTRAASRPRRLCTTSCRLTTWPIGLRRPRPGGRGQRGPAPHPLALPSLYFALPDGPRARFSGATTSGRCPPFALASPRRDRP
eukprot:4288891-Prymnesium_polylepis.1